MDQTKEQVVILLGSPRGEKSNSNIFSKLIEEKLNEQNFTTTKFFIKKSLNKSEEINEQFKFIKESKALFLITPLYVDSIPSMLLDYLVKLRELITNTDFEKTQAFLIINSGFPEPKHNRLAAKQFRLITSDLGFKYGGFIIIGCGEALNGRFNVKGVIPKPFAKKLNEGFEEMLNAVKNNEEYSKEIALLPKIVASKIGAWIFNRGWKKRIGKKINEKPYANTN